MTRLLIVTTLQCTISGFLLPYATHYRALGWQVDALAKGTTTSPACLAAFDQCFEADWSRNPLRPQGLLGMPRVLRQRVLQGGYDLVHLHTPVAAFITRLALRGLAGPKVVYTAHGFHFHDGRSWLTNAAFAALERLGGLWTDRLVVINRADEQEAARRHIVDPARIRYMPGIGLDLTQYDPARISPTAVAAVRAGLGLEPDQPLFLMVAGFQAGKRHRDLLEAFAALPGPEAHLAFAGEGPLLVGLQARAQALGLAKRVHFLGHRTDIPVLMRASLATILPSEREGLSRSVLESIALGVPVIGTDARGVRDLLMECGGLLVPVGDRAALTGAMVRLLQDPAQAQALGEQARSRVGRFHLDHLLTMHDALYAELLDRPVNSRS